MAVAVLGASTAWDFVREAESLVVQPVPARVVDYGVRVVDGMHRWVVEYRYDAGGVERTGLRRFPTPSARMPREDDADDPAGRFLVGAAITAYVNPLDPSDAVIDRGFRGSTLGSLLFLCAAIVAVISIWRAWKRRGRADAPGRLNEHAEAGRTTPTAWFLRTRTIVPRDFATIVFAVATVNLGGLLFILQAGRPSRASAALVWLAGGALTALAYFHARRRRDAGAYRWAYEPARRVLLAPLGREVRRDDLERLTILKEIARSDDAPRYEVELVLQLRGAAPLPVECAHSDTGFGPAMAEIEPVARFLARELDLPLDIAPDPS